MVRWLFVSDTPPKCIDREGVEKAEQGRYVARFTTHVQTYLATNQVFASCGILTSDWLKLCGRHAIHGIYVTRCKTSLLWAGKTGNISCTDFATT